MAIPSITASVATASAFGNQAQEEGAQKNLLPGLQRNDARSSTQLSPFGQVKLNLDDLQAKAQAIRQLSIPPTLSDFKVAVQGVVQSFNALNKTVNAVSSNTQTAKATSIADSRPVQALNEVRNAIAGPEEGSLGALRKIGINLQQDGTFGINQQRLEKSFQDSRNETLNTLNEVSSRIEKTTNKQLSSNSLIDQKSSNLNDQINDAEKAGDDARERLDQKKDFQQLQKAQLAQAGGYAARNAVVTYLSVASL